MKQMEQASFLRARDYLWEYGRKVDVCRFAYMFEGGSPQEVLDALRPFQNEDGGFGHGLEPDIRTPASSVIATTHAFEVLREVDAPASDPLVQGGLRYLVEWYDLERQAWPMTSSAVEDAPHAPWWTYETQDFGGFVINPTAAVVGYLHDYQDQLPDGFLANALQSVEQTIHGTGTSVDMHELMCILTLVETRNLAASARARLEEMLTRVLPASVEPDPTKWESYGLQPLQVAPSPDSIGAKVLPGEWIERNLDYWVETQGDDGSWPLQWSWADVDENAWRAAERDWKGYRIVSHLRTLRACGRIA